MHIDVRTSQLLLEQELALHKLNIFRDISLDIACYLLFSIKVGAGRVVALLVTLKNDGRSIGGA